MPAKPLAESSGLEWLRYMNQCNSKGGKTPLSQHEIAQLFAYIQTLEGLARSDSDIADMRNRLGLGVGPKGKGFKSRRAIRAELARMEKEYQRGRLRAQRRGWRAKLPFYTARIERKERDYIATLDEMPGVYGAGRTVSSALHSLAGGVELSAEVSRRAMPAPRTAKKRR